MVTRIDEGRPSMSRGRRWRIAFFAIVAVVVIAILGSARFYTDVLWFQEVGLSSVLWKSLSTQFALGAVVALVVGVIVWLNLFVTARVLPTYRLDPTGRADPLDRYRLAIGPYLKWIRVGVATLVGVMSGLGAGAAWRTFLLYVNRTDFGVTDPQFNKDVGFYMFELPFFDLVLSWLWFALIASLVVSAAAYYFQGSIRPESGFGGIQSGALAHLSVLLGLLALVKAGQYYLGTFQLNFSPRGVVDGASYTDVHAQLPALRLLAIISIISAVLFLVNIQVRRFSLPLAAVGIWILTALLAGGAWPFWVQRFSVEPQEQQREAEFIQRNIAATREAFGIDVIETRPFAASSTLTGEDVNQSENVLQNIRLWDPPILRQAYEQLQAIRPYYKFDDVDIDRYEIDGQTRQVLLSARELSLQDLSAQARSWQNEHLQFTHGFGLVASLANESTPTGQPDFLVKDLPGTFAAGTEALEADQPGLYFGESFDSGEYSIVNSKQEEVDYGTETEVVRSSYAGAGGINLGNIFKRTAFAIREGDLKIILSDLITSDSRILIYKNVRDRVTRAAPFLSYDHDPYIALVDGRLVWILDAYTTSNFYPYSQRFEADEIVPSSDSGVIDTRINYIRNPVKVVIDAYHGTMDFYVVDESDPMIRAWRGAFPDLFTDKDPTADLRAHFRYPEDLFKIQSEVYLGYHITDPADFYTKEDEWAIPPNPQRARTRLEGIPEEVPPRYLLFSLPGEPEEEFLLTRPFTPRGRPNMISLLVARNDPQVYGELLTLSFPRQKVVLGPTQVDNIINQDVEISQTLTLLGQVGSGVDFGALVTLPIQDSILYIQPLFVTAENVGIPELKKVALVFGEKAVMEDTFEEALGSLFDLGIDEPTAEPTPGPSPSPDQEPSQPSDLRELIQRAADLFDKAQEALSDGDFERYGKLIKRVGRLIDQAANF